LKWCTTSHGSCSSHFANCTNPLSADFSLSATHFATPFSHPFYFTNTIQLTSQITPINLSTGLDDSSDSGESSKKKKGSPQKGEGEGLRLSEDRTKVLDMKAHK